MWKKITPYMLTFSFFGAFMLSIHGLFGVQKYVQMQIHNETFITVDFQKHFVLWNTDVANALTVNYKLKVVFISDLGCCVHNFKFTRKSLHAPVVEQIKAKNSAKTSRIPMATPIFNDYYLCTTFCFGKFDFDAKIDWKVKYWA